VGERIRLRRKNNQYNAKRKTWKERDLVAGVSPCRANLVKEKKETGITPGLKRTRKQSEGTPKERRIAERWKKQDSYGLNQNRKNEGCTALHGVLATRHPRDRIHKKRWDFRQTRGKI